MEDPVFSKVLPIRELNPYSLAISQCTRRSMSVLSFEFSGTIFGAINSSKSLLIFKLFGLFSSHYLGLIGGFCSLFGTEADVGVVSLGDVSGGCEIALRFVPPW
jgi:hypothetical protein